jgi:hypothetical protein
VRNRARSLPRVVLVAGGLLLAISVALVALFAAGVPPAEEKRALAAAPGAEHNLIHEIVLLGFLKVRVQELVFNKFDALTGFSLSIVSVAALMVAAFIRSVGGTDWRRLFRFWLVVGVGAAFLAFDELASFHESAGFTWELWFGSIPGFEYEGDLIIALYIVPAAAFLFLERRQIARSRLCVRLLIAAAVLFVINAFLDSTGSHLDELVEMVIAAMLVVAFTHLALNHLGSELRSVGIEPRPLLPERHTATVPRFDAVPVAGDGVRPST